MDEKQQKEENKMSILNTKEDLKELVEKLNFKEKVERSKALIREAYKVYGGCPGRRIPV